MSLIKFDCYMLWARYIYCWLVRIGILLIILKLVWSIMLSCRIGWSFCYLSCLCYLRYIGWRIIWKIFLIVGYSIFICSSNMLEMVFWLRMFIIGLNLVKLFFLIFMMWKFVLFLFFGSIGYNGWIMYICMRMVGF